jgi:RNA polymerase sigma-70 factor (ECF subfamily)
VQVAAVTEAAAGEERSDLERVFVAHQARVFRAAYRITGNAQDAEDVLQSVFLRLARQAEGTLDVANASSYLYRAAINTAFDLLRSRRIRPNVPLDEAADAPGTLPGPDAAQEAAEIRHWLRRALATLPPRAAEIFALRYLEGQANRDIARLLGVSRISVAVSLHRTRQRLQSELGQWKRGRR